MTSIPPTAQGALDSSGTVEFSEGRQPISAALIGSTIGQKVFGQGMAGTRGGTKIIQTTEGANGFEFKATPDNMPPWGAGPYALQLRDITFEQEHNGTGTGVVIGDIENPTGGAAYCTIASVCAAKFKVGFDFAGNGVFAGQMMVVQGPGVETTDSIGLLVSGGQPNSIFIAGFTGGNVDTMLRWVQAGTGNWIHTGDWGACRVGADLGDTENNGGQLTIAGGNMEASISETVFNVRTNFLLNLIGVGGHGERTTPAINLNGGYGQLRRRATGIGMAAGIPVVVGAGYGNSWNDDATYADECYEPEGIRFGGQLGPIFRAALASRLPADAAHYNCIRSVIGDETGPGGVARVAKNWTTGEYFHAFSNEDEP